MKFPIDFNDSYPLTLGVSDDYFTISTRLKRLGRAPHQPRPGVTWLVLGALLTSFGAVVPLRLTARAQTERKAVTLSGTVKDGNGRPVGNATVYLSLKNRAEPLETTDTGADGHYTFTSPIEENRLTMVWADAGARGLGLGYISQDKSGARLANPVIAPRAPVKLLLVAPDGSRAADVRLSVGRIGDNAPGEQWVVPRPLEQKLQTQTNARGEAVFAGLPVGQWAQFWLSDQKFYPDPGAFGDLRGGQYAPISADDAVKIGRAKSWKTIRLVAPVALRGRVTTPEGNPKSGALILARRIGADTQLGFGTEIVAQARAGADGAYAMDGLAPGFYRIEVAAESWLTQNYVSPVIGRALKAPENRVDLTLARGGLIRGVLRNKNSKTPLVGNTVSLLDGQRNYQQTVTDENGVFRFRANTKGMALVWAWGGEAGFKLPSSAFDNKWGLLDTEMDVYGDTVERGFHLSSTLKFKQMMMVPWMPDAPGRDAKLRRYSEFKVTNAALLPVKAGTTREIIIESSLKPLAKTATLKGLVTLPNGKGASANIMVRPAVNNGYGNAIEKQTDARGRYSITGLKPGRYKIIAYLYDDTKANWAAPALKRTLAAGDNRGDIKLSRGALITGVVWAKSDHHVIPGVEVLTADEDGDGTIVKTKSNGVFRFRVAPGRIAVRLHSNGTPPAGFALTQQEFIFEAKDGGGEMHTTFDLPAARNIQPTEAATAATVGDRAATAKANLAKSRARAATATAKAIAEAKAKSRLSQQFTSPADAATATGTIIGTVRDEGGRPLAGIRVWAYAPELHQFNGSTTVTTDADGKYRIEKFPKDGKFAIIALPGAGYSTLPEQGDNNWGLDFRQLAAGQTRVVDVRMRAAPATLAGKVLKSDGTLAVGYHVSPRNMKRTGVSVKANGKFWLAGVWSGPRDVYVYDLMSRKRWGPYRAAHNQRDLVLRLSEKKRDKNYVLGGGNN